MVDIISEKDIRNALKKVMHPVVQRSLMDLGIIKQIVVKDENVMITLKFPFVGKPAEHIATREKILNSVREQVEMLGMKVELKQAQMNREDFQSFLAMERETWNDLK